MNPAYDTPPYSMVSIAVIANAVLHMTTHLSPEQAVISGVTGQGTSNLSQPGLKPS